jgi:hypothetical protein
MEKEITMKMIKEVVLNLQKNRLKLELKRDVLDENKISFLRKDILKLQNYINENN